MQLAEPFCKMSPDDEKTRQRSVKLCQLAYERQIDKEIGYEIRKLIEEGVLIDFQDQNRNKKTALHLAVEQGDIICVKFLLRFKPNLELKDENGKTPVDLAESKGDQNILNALLNSTVDVVNESFVEVFDFVSLTRQKVEVIKLKPTFKVLKLIDCSSVNEVWTKLNDHDYTAAFNESSHFFFIAIETKETNIDNNHELMKKVLNVRRPMVVQLSSPDCQNTKTYFKDDKKDFEEITDTTQVTQEEFNEAFESKDECNMKLLLAALRSNLFGQFTGNLLDTKLNINEYRAEAVNQFARSNALCHRFLKLYDESQPQIDTIVAALSFKGDQSLLALLDLPFELKDPKLKLNDYQQEILSVVDSSGYNLLMMAVELNNLDATKLLLRCSCDFNYSDSHENRASDVCWEVKAFECLAELIEAGSPYPYNFTTDEFDESCEAHKRINAMTEAINSFHANIEDGKIEEVKKFISTHPHIKHAYDTKNYCALTVALQSDQVDIYSVLMSEGFEPGTDDEYYTALKETKFKSEIRNSHQTYFKEAFDEPYLKRLFEKSKLSFGSKDRAKCSTVIRKMFEKLNEIDEIIPILLISSLDDKLRIVFDFNCNSVVDMVVETGSSSSGIVYPSEGFIYIGAKNHETEFYKVIGTLIHELTHYAMKLTYGNTCKPYDDDDIESTHRFKTITEETKKICEENTSTDPIVTTVFTCYPESVWQQELIVRVPHLLAHYKTNPQMLKAAERNIPELFHFYREKTLKDVERESKFWLQEYLISKINNQTGISRKIQNLNVQFKIVENVNLKPSANVIKSNAPQLTLALLRQLECDDSHIFVTLEQVAIGNILDKIAKVNAKESSTALIVDCIGLTQKYQESVAKLLKRNKNLKTIALVMTEAESAEVKENFSKVEFKTFTHKWDDLTDSSKENLLNQNVIFQGCAIKLNELVDPSSEAMNFFPLDEIVDCKDFKIANKLSQQSQPFYISRKFIKKGQYQTGMGAMIISDEAGSGKSVTLFEIAKSLHDVCPDQWVMFVDLKRHIEAFKMVEDCKKIETFEDFISEQILKNQTKFDRELFKQMFRAGKTFVLFDGFDEISPNYKELLLHVLKLFKPRSGIRLYITTRPLLESDLEAVLGKFVFKIEEFSKESQTSFLRDYWQSVKFEMSHEDFEVLSNRLLRKFSQIAISDFIGLPLLMRMTAEIFDGSSKENLLHKVESLSIASVFQEFVKKYFLRWTNNENEISRIETVDFQREGAFNIHHNVAINHIFGYEFKSFDIDESDAEKISRVGLIRYNKTEKTFQFIHETFAEYFVADFICFHLNRKNRSPSHECSLAIEVLVDVLVSYDFRVIKTFLNETFENLKFNPNEVFCKFVAKCFCKVLNRILDFDFLRKSLFSSQKYLSSLLLSIVIHIEKDVLMKILQSKTNSIISALDHAAAYGSNEILSALCNIIATCTDNPKEIYQQKSDLELNVLLIAAGNLNGGTLTALCENLNSVLSKDEIEAMFEERTAFGVNILFFGANNSNHNVFVELLSWLPNYLAPEEIKRLFQEVNNKNLNFFHGALTSDTSESLKLKFGVIKRKFDVEEQKLFFYQPATAPNMFQCAAENLKDKIFDTLIESTRDVFSTDDIKSMLMQEDSEGSNVLHYTAELGDANKLNELNLLLRERLSDNEIRRLLLEVNKNGKNCFRLAFNNTKINLQVFCETIGNLISIKDQTRLLEQSTHDIDIVGLACGNHATEILPVEIIKFLLTRENNRRSAVHKVASEGDVAEWNKFISFAQARLSVEEMKSFLFSRERNGSNCLHLAVLNNSNNIVEAVVDAIKNVSTVKDQKKFVQYEDYADRNVFFLKPQGTNEMFMQKWHSLHDCLGTILTKDEIKKMLMQEKDSDGDNILVLIINHIKIRDMEWIEFMAFLQKILANDDIKELFFNVNREGKTFFHCAVECFTRLQIKSLSGAIKEILSLNEQKKFFGIKNPNVFHSVVQNKSLGIVSTIHECLQDVLSVEEIRSLMQEKSSENKNILHLICKLDPSGTVRTLNYDNEERLRDFLKVLNVICDARERKNFLTSSDSNGSNCLHLAARFKGPHFLKTLFGFFQRELSIDDQRKLFQNCDNDGTNIFGYVSFNRDEEVRSSVKQFARGILSENQIDELMNQTAPLREITIHLEIARGRRPSGPVTDL